MYKQVEEEFRFLMKEHIEKVWRERLKVKQTIRLFEIFTWS